MNTVKSMPIKVKPLEAQIYTTEQMAKRNCPVGVYKAVNPDLVGYWVVSSLALIHFDNIANRINSLSTPSKFAEGYVRVEDATVVFDIVITSK